MSTQNQSYWELGETGTRKMMPASPWILSTGPDDKRPVERNDILPSNLPSEGLKIDMEENLAPLAFRESWALIGKTPSR